jgi:hypothetical protein
MKKLFQAVFIILIITIIGPACSEDNVSIDSIELSKKHDSSNDGNNEGDGDDGG